MRAEKREEQAWQPLPCPGQEKHPHLPSLDATAGDDGLCHRALAGNLYAEGLQQLHQRPTLLPGQRIGPVTIREMQALLHVR